MTHITEEIIQKFIDNRCSDEELILIRRWIDESDENARLIFELEETAMLAESLNPDKSQYDRIWASIKDKISSDKLRQRKRRRINILRWSSAAAVFIAIVLVGVMFFTRQPQINMIELKAGNETMAVILPDSTKVWLNRNASITYPEAFAGDSRNVSITGEAYFEVTRDPSRPFTVAGKWLDVTVLGTKFNFNSSADSENTVSLLEGKVEVVAGHNRDGVVLAPGQKAEFNPHNGQMSVTSVNTVLDAVWHDRLIHFHNATIQEIASDLEELYNVEITIRPSVDRTRTYSGVTVSYESVDSTLSALCATLPLVYDRHGQNVILSGKK